MFIHTPRISVATASDAWLELIRAASAGGASGPTLLWPWRRISRNTALVSAADMLRTPPPRSRLGTAALGSGSTTYATRFGGRMFLTSSDFLGHRFQAVNSRAPTGLQVCTGAHTASVLIKAPATLSACCIPLSKRSSHITYYNGHTLYLYQLTAMGSSQSRTCQAKTSPLPPPPVGDRFESIGDEHHRLTKEKERRRRPGSDHSVSSRCSQLG